jgi:DNA-directed RNA polymerase subunit RPC12/RpoP
MMHFKLCLRCNGDVILKQDTYGSFYQCLHCGNIMELDIVHTLVKANEELLENANQGTASSDLVNSKEMILH